MTKFSEEDIKAMRLVPLCYDERSLVVEETKPLRKEGFPLAQLMVASIVLAGALCAIAASFILQW